MGNIPVIDLEEALNRAMGDGNFLKMMLEELRSTIPDFMARIEKADLAGDMESLGKTAHQFKGAAANLGAKTIAAAALELEQSSKGADAEGCRAALELLNQAIAEFRRHLDRIDWTATTAD